jgi:hypothetical protein
MVAFVDIIIIIDNNQYSLPIQYIESDMMLLPLTLFKFFISWDIPTANNQLSLHYVHEQHKKDDPSIEKYYGGGVDQGLE